SVTNSRRLGPSGRCAPVAATSRGSGTIISGMNELSKDAVNWLTVGDDSAGQRVDNFLTKVLKGVPKSHIYRILRSGEVRVNKGRVGPDVRLALGAVVRVTPVKTSVPAKTTGVVSPRRFGPKVPILFEDDAMIVVDKPS